MRIGSLFSGAGGLDMAVEAVFGGTVVWQCEFNQAASKVLECRYPGVPNFGDVTAVDWDTVEPVDIMCGGYPCQPFSAAGQRKGTDDERPPLALLRGGNSPSTTPIRRPGECGRTPHPVKSAEEWAAHVNQKLEDGAQ